MIADKRLPERVAEEFGACHALIGTIRTGITTTCLES